MRVRGRARDRGAARARRGDGGRAGGGTQARGQRPRRRHPAGALAWESSCSLKACALSDAVSLGILGCARSTRVYLDARVSPDSKSARDAQLVAVRSKFQKRLHELDNAFYRYFDR